MRIREGFDKQGFMKTLGAELISVEQGKVVIGCPFSEKLTQHHGFFHAGVMTTLADNACGFAALSVQDEHHDILTAEFKVNFLRPAQSTQLIAVGQVVHAGKTLVVCDGLVYDHTQTKIIAKMTSTLMVIRIQ